MTTTVKLMAVYLFPNGMVMSFDQQGRQVPLLQGVNTPELRERIIRHHHPRTVFNGCEHWKPQLYCLQGNTPRVPQPFS